MKTNKLWGWLWVGLGVLYFTLPLLATLEFSLRAKKGQLSLLAYQRVFQDPQFAATLSFSLVMGVLTIVASLALIVPTAYWVRLRLPKLRPVVEFITLMPFVVPAIEIAMMTTMPRASALPSPTLCSTSPLICAPIRIVTRLIRPPVRESAVA